MEIAVAVFIPVAFLGVGVALLIISQITGFIQHQQYSNYRQMTRSRALMQLAQIARADVLLHARAGQLQHLAVQLQGSNQELLHLNTMREKFFSMMVHDLRNPLTTIRGFFEMIATQVDHPVVRESTPHILRASDYMNRLMADLTDMSMIEAGKIRVELSTQDLREALEELAGRQVLLAERRGLNFRFDAPPAALGARFDKNRLVRVITNLIDNACKFTPRGGSVELSLREEGRWAVIRVLDTGPGIHPQERARIFEKFYQSMHQSDAAKSQGWGLGLSIASEIVRLHGGLIGVESKGLGKGSTFWVKLPAKRAAVAAPPRSVP